MYSVTTLEGALLALAVLTATTALVFGVLVGFPRALQTVSAGVACPLVGHRAMAELDRDAWTLRCVDVRRCSVLGGRDVVLCSKACL
jgi:hypothetical protein